MTHSILFLYLLLLASLPRELKLKKLAQLDSSGARFDLSGILIMGEKIYVVSDKDWDRYLYEIKVSENTFAVMDEIPLDDKGLLGPDLDLEGIDYCDGTYYLINEKGNQVITADLEGSAQVLSIDYSSIQENPSNWNRNAGYEGIALDCQNGIMYLAKERSPRFLVTIDLNTGKATGKANLATQNDDVSDLYYEEGYLYVLERNAFQITKVDASSMEIVETVSYNDVCNSPDGKLFEPSKYGMAEALLMTEKEIWIGLDNNSVPVSDHAGAKYKISGSNPVILVFVRPQGF